MGILSWVIFGALTGWVASRFLGANDRQGCLVNGVIGVLGAFISGFVIELVTGNQFSFDFNIRSFIVAVLGSVALLGLFTFLRLRIFSKSRVTSTTRSSMIIPGPDILRTTMSNPTETGADSYTASTVGRAQPEADRGVATPSIHRESGRLTRHNLSVGQQPQQSSASIPHKLDDNQSRALFDRLDIQRSTLALYLKQLAILGSAYAPPGLSHGIHETRQEISKIKATLRNSGIGVSDQPDDEG